MLPLLPALILLLLQGPSSFERLVVDGRLPAALEAMHRQMANPGSEKLSDRDQEVLATLLAASGDGPLNHSFFAYLLNREERNQAQVIVADESRAPIDLCGDSPPPQDGFERYARTRDGPVTSGSAC